MRSINKGRRIFYLCSNLPKKLKKITSNVGIHNSSFSALEREENKIMHLKHKREIICRKLKRVF